MDRKEIWNPPGSWMDNIDTFLLERLWEKKGSPGIFRRSRWGVDMFAQLTLVGTLWTCHDEVLTMRKGESTE